MRMSTEIVDSPTRTDEAFEAVVIKCGTISLCNFKINNPVFIYLNEILY